MKKGTSIVEIIIYATILAVLSVFVINNLLIASTVVSKIRLQRRVNTNADVIMQKLIREIRLASSINASSTFGVNTSDVSLNTFVSASNTTPVNLDFYLVASNLFMKKGNAAATMINDPGVVISRFLLNEVVASTSRAVKIELTIQANTARSSTTDMYYGTAILRGSY